jgi:hypothetical protein
LHGTLAGRDSRNGSHCGRQCSIELTQEDDEVG